MATAAAGEIASDTRWMQRKGGVPIWVQGLNIGLFGQQQELLGYGKILQDVTEQKVSDDNLRALRDALEYSNVIVSRWDGRIEYWTRGCEQIYGRSSREVIGRFFLETLPVKFSIPYDQVREQLLATGYWIGTGRLSQ